MCQKTAQKEPNVAQVCHPSTFRNIAGNEKKNPRKKKNCAKIKYKCDT